MSFSKGDECLDRSRSDFPGYVFRFRICIFAGIRGFELLYNEVNVIMFFPGMT